jgi:predicted Holliday junction resolvase-like endonuclease
MKTENEINEQREKVVREFTARQIEGLKEQRLITKWTTLAVLTVLLIIMLGMFGCPRYNVWQQEMSGKAEFAKAEQNRKIRILEADANLESQKLNASAEIERAKGVAESNKIINGTLTESYLRYFWIQGMQTNQMQVVYVPTEAGMPILEAGKAPNR